jgi:predicted ester cyclase
VDIVDKLATKVTMKAMFSDGDKAVLHLGFTGVHKKDAFGYAATGKQVEWDAVEIYRFTSDGRIAEVWHYSRIPLLEQLGMQGMETHRRL